MSSLFWECLCTWFFPCTFLFTWERFLNPFIFPFIVYWTPHPKPNPQVVKIWIENFNVFASKKFQGVSKNKMFTRIGISFFEMPCAILSFFPWYPNNGHFIFSKCLMSFFLIFFSWYQNISIKYHRKIKIKIKIFCHGILHWVMPSKHGVPKINAPQLHLRGIYFGITLLLQCYSTPMWQPTHPPSLAQLPTHLATHLLTCNMAIYNMLHNIGFGVNVAKTQISLIVFFFFFLCKQFSRWKTSCDVWCVVIVMINIKGFLHC